MNRDLKPWPTKGKSEFQQGLIILERIFNKILSYGYYDVAEELCIDGSILMNTLLQKIKEAQKDDQA